jgi:hypothetical protein
MLPDQDSLQPEILEALYHAEKGRMKARLVYNLLAQSHPEVDYEERTRKYRNSQSHWANRVQWARQQLVDRGFVFRANAGPNPEFGVWIITDEGRKYIARFHRRRSADPSLRERPSSDPRNTIRTFPTR